MDKEVRIPIYVLDEEATKFILFQKHYELFSLLLDRGVFDLRNGSIVLNFDSDGILQNIQRADILYKRGA